MQPPKEAEAQDAGAAAGSRSGEVKTEVNLPFSSLPFPRTAPF
jgi:hypothetical protein